MVTRTKTIAQLRREIASQRKRLTKEQSLAERITERNRLSRELFELRNRSLIEAGSKAKRLSKRFGRRLLKVGKVVGPALQKQARLIREQQLRDDAIARRVGRAEPPKVKRSKKTKKKSRKKPRRKKRRK